MRLLLNLGPAWSIRMMVRCCKLLIRIIWVITTRIFICIIMRCLILPLPMPISIIPVISFRIWISRIKIKNMLRILTITIRPHVLIHGIYISQDMIVTYFESCIESVFDPSPSLSIISKLSNVEVVASILFVSYLIFLLESHNLCFPQKELFTISSILYLDHH